MDPSPTPFFARYLEHPGRVAAAGVREDGISTMKYPSDEEDAATAAPEPPKPQTPPKPPKVGERAPDAPPAPPDAPEDGDRESGA